MTNHPFLKRLLAIASLIAALGLLYQQLETPPLTPAQWFSFVENTDISIVLVGLLVPISGLIITYLLLVTLVETVASLIGFWRFSQRLSRVTPILWRRLVLQPLTVGTLGLPTLFAPFTGIAMADTSTSLAQAPPITMTWVTPSTSESATVVVEETIQVEDHEVDLLEPLSGPIIYQVQRGDSLWKIAENHLLNELAIKPSLVEIHAYWQELISENLERLPQPGNPDLIYAGLELVMPTL